MLDQIIAVLNTIFNLQNKEVKLILHFLDEEKL